MWVIRIARGTTTGVGAEAGSKEQEARGQGVRRIIPMDRGSKALGRRQYGECDSISTISKEEWNGLANDSNKTTVVDGTV